MEPPYTITGEIEGVPIKRYGRGARGPLKNTPQGRRLLALRRMSEKRREEIKQARFHRLSPDKKAASMYWQAAKKARQDYEELKAQRLRTFGIVRSENASASCEAHRPFGSGASQPIQGASAND